MQPPLFPDNQIFSVSQITGLVKELLETSFRDVTVEGEISNFRPSSAGHIYFTLKDSSSQLGAVLFRANAMRLNFQPKDGDKVRCTGSFSVYAPRGNYQLIVTKMERAGSGNILQMLEERKQRLAAEGLFDQSRKKRLPFLPKTIGVVTSATGAAVRDILRITKRRNRTVSVIIFPAIVQGEGAAQTIVKMIQLASFYKMCDVLIVGRGGGSLEDLLPFSEESVVRAVAASEIPVISAVGHEIDWALCDFAADVRASTPSAAAELAVPELADLQQQLQLYRNELYRTMTQKVEQKRLLIKSFNPDTLEIRFRTIQQPLLNRFANAKDSLYKNLQDKIKALRTRLENSVTVLENASPETIFRRGYSMVRIKNTGQVLRSTQGLLDGDEIEITPAEGRLDATVTKIIR